MILQHLSPEEKAKINALQPRLFIDGNKWCLMVGHNLQEGFAGFGITADGVISNLVSNPEFTAYKLPKPELKEVSATY